MSITGAKNMSQKSPQKSLHVFLAENDFYLDKNLSEAIEKVILSSSHKAFLLRGPAGAGKTQLTYLVAKWMQANYIFYQCTYGSSEDELIYKYVPSDASKSGIKITLGPLPRALALSRKEKVVLVLDEFDKTRPTADAILLDLLQNFRLSLYIEESESIIQGSPENLIIFLTSNDMREFSEPLLRRVVAITLKPLPTQKVLEILSKKFKKEVALLLSQVYDDTVNAGLRKPATIQELFQLGEVLESSPSIPLDDLVRMFIVKYDDDWVKYKQYVVSRKMFEFLNRTEQKMSNEISKYYEPSEQEVEVQQQSLRVQEATTSTISQVLEKIAKVVVRQPQKLPETREEVKEDIEATFKAFLNESDASAYTAIVKKLRPEPSDSGDVIGKFRVIKSGSELNIVSKEPLTLAEYVKLLDLSNASFEAYIEDRVFLLNPSTVNWIIDNADNVYYYSKKKIRTEHKNQYITELVEVELESPYTPTATRVVDAVLRAYVKVGQGKGESPLLARLLPDNICKSSVSARDDYAGLIEKCVNINVLDVEIRDVDDSRNILETINRIVKQRGYVLEANVSREDRKLRVYLKDKDKVVVFGW
jgi:MoxR-like ATPase